MIPTVEWLDDKNQIRMIDQTKLTKELLFLEISDFKRVAQCIKDMNVRGAPAIGVTAAMGVALAALEYQDQNIQDFKNGVYNAIELLKNTRPTAVNLFWAVERVWNIIQIEIKEGKGPKEICKAIIKESKRMWMEDIDINLQMGRIGANVLESGDTVLTHCNAGSLGTVQYGTALSVIRWAIEKNGKKINVIVDETRPRLQGARLTAFELNYDNIPFQIECDNTAALMMRLGKIQKVIVGADRIVEDAVFNKIGTYMLAISAKYHKIPFYVVAPASTLSLKEKEKEVKIEQRDGLFEVGKINGLLGDYSIAPEGAKYINYAFDATPMSLISAIITEDGNFTPEKLLEYYIKD